MKNALGDKLTGVIDRELFLKNSHARVAGSSNESMISLRGRRIVWASETEEGRRMSLANMKDLSGSHIMEAIPKYGKQVQWKRTHTPILLTNFLPKVESQGLAEWTRIRVLKFKLSFIDAPDPAKPWERKVDPMLGNRIDETELPGVLNFLIEGCAEWYQHGLQTPDCVRRDTAVYKQDEDMIAVS